ncbi:uncharacterized protein LOC143905807 [Temnothorax americanus]|uniref:uncharacterized protein LOC143905807 n=1 Tax=Temnothorax americanus TaxID=1964332 RepID=UPI004067786F
MKGCTNRSGKGNYRFFSFQKKRELCEKWLMACGRRIGEIKEKNAPVCSAHFNESCYMKVSFVDELAGTPRNSRPLNPDAVPFAFPGNDDFQQMLHEVCELSPVNVIATSAETSTRISAPISNLADQISEATVTCEDPMTSTLDISASDQMIGEFNEMSSSIEPAASTSAATSTSIIGSILMTNAKDTPSCPDNCVALKNALTVENRNLRQQLKRCNKLAERKWRNKMQNLLRRVFSPGQVKLFLNPEKRKLAGLQKTLQKLFLFVVSVQKLTVI